VHFVDEKGQEDQAVSKVAVHVDLVGRKSNFFDDVLYVESVDRKSNSRHESQNHREGKVRSLERDFLLRHYFGRCLSSSRD
jgi:hypothetical protein